MKKLLLAAVIVVVGGIVIGLGFRFLQNPRRTTGSIQLLLHSPTQAVTQLIEPSKAPNPANPAESSNNEPTDQTPPKSNGLSLAGSDVDLKTGKGLELLTPERVNDFIHSYYEGVENKDLERVANYYDGVVACGLQGLRTRTAIRTDLVHYFAQYRSLLIAIESVHVDVNPQKGTARASFVLRYKKIPEFGPSDNGHGTERWTLIVRGNRLAISSIEEQFFAAP